LKTKNTEIGNITITESKETQLFGTDALLLAAYIRKNPSATALELGSGSGVISIILAKRGYFKKIKAVEKQEELVSICKDNIKCNGVSEIIEPMCADVRELNPSEFAGTTVVFANPPYMKLGDGKESPDLSKQMARHELFGGIYEFSLVAGRILKTGGKLYVVYRPDRLETLMSAMKENGFAVKRMTFVSADERHEPSSVLVEAIRGGKEGLYVTPNLFLTKDGKETEDAAYVYENGSFPKHFLSK
jgi:tRNA1Val (adenine37-N6)-methyltransferase